MPVIEEIMTAEEPSLEEIVTEEEPVIDEIVTEEETIIDESVIDESVISEPVIDESETEALPQNSLVLMAEDAQNYLIPMATTASGTCGDSLTWTLSDSGTLTISGTGTMYDYSSSNTPWYSYTGSITSIVIQKGVTSIGNYAFFGCYKLTKITIPEGVTSIGIDPFGFSALTEITFPKSLTRIDSYAFLNWNSLKTIKVTSGNTAYKAINGILFSADGEKLIKYPENKGGTSYSIPAGVTSIEWYAFDGCNTLTKITIPEGVTSIESGAFSFCTALTAISIPKSVKSISSSAFSHCTALKEISLSEGVTKIYTDAFANCTSLTKITLPASLTLIFGSAFSDCTALTEIKVASGNAKYKSVDGILFSADGKTLVKYPAGKDATSYAIPAGVTKIGDYAFSDCAALTNITIPESVTSIKESAFLRCNGLTEITIPEGITSIVEQTFYACNNLAKITLPTGITKIAYMAFYSCDALTDVYFGGTEAEWNAITIGTHNSSLKNATIHFTDPCEKGHTEVIDEAKAPTCTETGLTEGKHCSVCGEVLTAQTVIPETGHTYTAEEFLWSDDLTSASTTLVCSCGHSEEGTCSLIWDNSQPLILTVTATAESNGQTFSESKTITAVANRDTITVTLPTDTSDIRIIAAAYNNDGKMTACVIPENTDNVFTLNIIGDTIHIFFTTTKYQPVSPMMVV